ncbi:MAG: metal-dependent transcriptional regulator [Candidatus Promineifilaceae bacterium]|nr:metal-dependent transcriptional regulator [Candidatus Promineifilaceae bacterium]
MKHAPFNESAEMYLKTVSELSLAGGMAPTSAVARRLAVSPVSATEMIHRLEEQGLVAHVPYRGTTLTADGARMARAIERCHRLWECLLFSHLGLAWEAVHELACRLEHATDPTVVDALDAYLGFPSTCPHGNTIDRAGTDAEAAEAPLLLPLASLAVGESATIRAIRPESSLLLKHLVQQGLQPGRVVTVLEVAPFDGPLLLALGGNPTPAHPAPEQRAVGQEVAAHLFVEHYLEAGEGAS